MANFRAGLKAAFTHTKFKINCSKIKTVIFFRIGQINKFTFLPRILNVSSTRNLSSKPVFDETATTAFRFKIKIHQVNASNKLKGIGIWPTPKKDVTFETTFKIALNNTFGKTRNNILFNNNNK